jgi:hypothetical protein
MIKRLIRWLFGSEYALQRAEVLAEAESMLASVKAAQTVRYVQYERIAPGHESFLYGIQPVLNNRTMISWMMEQRDSCMLLCLRAMANGEDNKVLHGMAQISMIESLLNDMAKFSEEYANLIERKAAERVAK